MRALLVQFTHDPGVRLALTLVALDVVLGVAAAVKAGSFRIGWLGDFLRADILFKLVPYFAVWAAVRVGGDVDLGGVGAIEETVNAAVVFALSGSILNSLRDLGVIPETTPDEVAGSAEAPPAP